MSALSWILIPQVPVNNSTLRMPQAQQSALSRLLGYDFQQPQLLQKALTHRSYAPEHNERLEFLGDSVLGCVIAHHLSNTFPELTEGELSRLRSNLVKEETLANFAQQLDLGSYLKLGEGERKSAGFRRPSTLADTLEAIFGAVFLDAGYEAAERVVLQLYVPYLAQVDIKTLGKDAKTLLQEYLQSKYIALPTYTVLGTKGLAHEQVFKVECAVPELKITTHGEGATRRLAEQQAARAAYQSIGNK